MYTVYMCGLSLCTYSLFGFVIIAKEKIIIILAYNVRDHNLSVTVMNMLERRFWYACQLSITDMKRTTFGILKANKLPKSSYQL